MLHLDYINGKNFLAQTQIWSGFGPKITIKLGKKSEALKKINEADLLTIDGFGLGTLTAQEQSLVYEIIKSRADNLSTIIVSQRPCADWYEWLGGKYITDGVADRIINFYYLIELKG